MSPTSCSIQVTVRTSLCYNYIPRTQLASIFECQTSKSRPFPIKTRVTWVRGIYIYIYIYRYCIIYSLPKLGRSPIRHKNLWHVMSFRCTKHGLGATKSSVKSSWKREAAGKNLRKNSEFRFLGFLSVENQPDIGKMVLKSGINSPVEGQVVEIPLFTRF